jgi:hypothetical protein
LLLSFLPDLPPLFSFAVEMLHRFTGRRAWVLERRGDWGGMLAGGRPQKSSSAAIGGGDGRRGKDTCKPTQVC